MPNKPFRPFFPEFWREHERVWTKPEGTTVVSVFLRKFHYDSKGIIYVERKLLDGKKIFYSPIRIMQHALRYYNEWLDDPKSVDGRKKKELFMIYAEWLLDNITETDSLAYWLHTDPMKLPGYRFDKPWIGCMDQGFGLSVLLRYTTIVTESSRKKRVKNILKKILNTFSILVENGGVRDEKDGVWFEEFGGTKRAHVLNGFMYSLMSLHEYYTFSNDMLAKKFFDEGIVTLKKELPRFETKHLLGFVKWTRYDSGRMFFSGWHYHVEVHIPQLKILYELTKEPFFSEYATRWENYSRKYGGIVRVVNTPMLAVLRLQGILGL
jgi:heparosan-N-sulfate-glucuronate 5-epimerase